MTTLPAVEQLEAVATYSSYPDYRALDLEHVWLPAVPTHWEIKRLKFSVDIVNEKTSADGVELPYIGLESIESNTGVVHGLYNENTADGLSNLFRSDDVLFGKLRPYLAKAWQATCEGLCSSELLVLRSHAVVPRFLLYYVLSEPFIATVNSSTYGSKMPRASWEYIGNLPLCIPPLDEQQAIAAFLDRETAKIDELVAKKRRLIELLAEKRTALISHAVTKGLNPDAEMKDSGAGWLGSVPKHWDVVRLRRVGRVGQGCSFPHAIQGNTSGDLPWFKVGDMNSPDNEVRMQRADNYVDCEVAKNAGAEVFPEGTVIFPRVGAALLTNKRRILTGPSLCDDNIFVFIPDAIHPEYAYFLLLLVDMASLASDGLVPTITFSVIKNLYIPLPPSHEQQELVSRIDAELGLIHSLFDEVERANQLLVEYRSALISAAVTGKIDLRREA